MQLQKAERKKAKIKMALSGPPGSGKTMSALLLAYGLCNDWSKIAVIDSENNSADLYAHLGDYLTLSISAPFTPERYTEALRVCEQAKVEVIIIDSISHEWEGLGGILNTHSGMNGNSFTNWGKLTPRHSQFIQAILHSQKHIIATIRTKQDYVIVEKNGKSIPEKVGLKGIQRDGIDYDFTIVFDLDIKNHATSSKDRTSLFKGKPEFTITPDTGKMLLNWCNNTSTPFRIDAAKQRINECKSLRELFELYKLYPAYQDELMDYFSSKRKEIEGPETNSITEKPKSNGQLIRTK